MSSLRVAVLRGMNILPASCEAEVVRWCPPLRESEPLTLDLPDALSVLRTVDVPYFADLNVLMHFAKTHALGVLVFEDGTRVEDVLFGRTPAGDILLPVTPGADYTCLYSLRYEGREYLFVDFDIIGIAGVEAFLCLRCEEVSL